MVGAVPVEVLRQVLRCLRLPRPDDEPQAGVVEVLQVLRRQHSGIGDHHHIGHVVAVLESLDHRDHRVRLGLVPFERVNLQGNPVRSTSSPMTICGSTRRSFEYPTLR